jgi:hypothetical protein
MGTSALPLSYDSADFNTLSTVSLMRTSSRRVPTSILEFDKYFDEKAYRICETSTVNVLPEPGEPTIILTAATLSSQTPTTGHLTPLSNCHRRFYSFCPASGRLVYGDDAGDCVICDFLST